MRKKRGKKPNPFLTAVLVLLFLAMAASIVLIVSQRGNAAPLLPFLEGEVPAPELNAGDYDSLIHIPQAETELGKLIRSAMTEHCSISFQGDIQVDRKEALQNAAFRYLDMEKLSEGLSDEVNALLAQAVQEAARADELYDENLNYKEDVLLSALESALTARLEAPEVYLSSAPFDMQFGFNGEAWELLNADETGVLISGLIPSDMDVCARQFYDSVSEKSEYVRKIYTIAEDALAGPAPDQSRFGVTDDPAVISELLQSPAAKILIGSETLAWSPDIELIPGSSIHYYLDDSILTIVWQEEEARAVGTFAEIFIADGSQLRRRIAGDRFEDFNHETTSSFAQKTNAVLTLGGDFYHHGRNCGIVVYNREIYRFKPDSSDNCYITADGDMLFSYRGQFETLEEAQAFVEENDILFSLCFGPVLIDNGVDVTPEYYPWGEVNDRYARSALGMFGEHHYLTMNINCYQPGYYYLATLRQAADAMVQKGCVKAYALDGGQTATTVFNDKLINPVQFGWEKNISDVIYFASAIPEELSE